MHTKYLTSVNILGYSLKNYTLVIFVLSLLTYAFFVFINYILHKRTENYKLIILTRIIIADIIALIIPSIVVFIVYVLQISTPTNRIIITIFSYLIGVYIGYKSEIEQLAEELPVRLEELEIQKEEIFHSKIRFFSIAVNILNVVLRIKESTK